MRAVKLFLGCYFLFAASIIIADKESLLHADLLPQKIFSKHGNIFCTINNSMVQITHSGKDHDPVLSYDKKIIAFARAAGSLIPENCDSDGLYKNADQIWVYDVLTKKERILFSKKPTCVDPEKMVVNIDQLGISPDNKKIYFTTQAFATSDAVHVININGSNEHYFTDGGGFEIIPKGLYKGYLIIGQHRHFIGGGSFDWNWLFSPKGKEEGPLGEDVTKDQRKFLELS